MHDKFFKTLFEFNQDNYILVWTFNKDNTKESHWFNDYKQAAAFIKTLPAIDVYVGVGLSPKSYGPHARCLQKDIIGIPALWIDIDIQDAVHKKPNLPGSIKEAMKLFDWLEQKPTMIVNSGHGLQAWWVFNEPWTFDGESEHSDAASLAKRFVYGFKLHAAKYNWDVDSVHNLDRVLRVPGTMNCKSKLVPVELIECNDLRYNPSDFEDILPEVVETDYTVTVDSIEGQLVLKPGAKLNMAKFEALAEVESKFKLSWEHKRKDLQDQSASSYDLALVNYAAKAGWSSQELADLMIAHREKYRTDLKLRQDYYQRTISVALKNAERYRAEEEILSGDTENPEDVRERLSKTLNLKITGFCKYVTDRPVYKLITSDYGDIMFDGVETLSSPTKFRNQVMAVTNTVPPRFKTDKWDSVLKNLFSIVEEVTIGEEATEKGQASSWLEQYLGDKPVMENAETAMVSGDPFRQDGNTYIFGPDFRKWIRVVHMEKVSPKQLGSMLRAIGAEPEVLRIETEAGRTTRSVWRLR
jgi:hypothetical protein